jgi:site-specific DNA-methyltransferase (adenine-specific)
MIKLIHGDCLEEMDKLIEQDVKVDAIITDPPYGITDCKWDSVIPFASMWKRLNKLIKDYCAIVLFGSEPFSSALRMSNIKNYKYDWDWDKMNPTGVMYARHRPMQQTERISVFSKNGEKTKYNPQMRKREKRKFRKVYKGYLLSDLHNKELYKKKVLNNQGNNPRGTLVYYDAYNPTTLLEFSKITKAPLHPTQKPIELMEYLIKTYTDEGETVLDFTMGSGTTGAACKKLKRNFIGIEIEEKYFNIAKERIKNQPIFRDIRKIGHREITKKMRKQRKIKRRKD